MSRKIEIRASSHGGPPGAGGQQTQRSTLWFRVDDGEWRRVGWTASAIAALQAVEEMLESPDRYWTS